MTTPFKELRQANKKEQAENQPSSQPPPLVSWSNHHPNQLFGREQFPSLTQTHPTIRADTHSSSGFNITDSLESAFPQDSFADISYSSTLTAHFDALGHGVTGEWSIQHSQHLPGTHSQSFGPRVQHQGQIQPTSDFQPRPNLEQSGQSFTHLSGIPTHSTSYSTRHHPLSPMPPTTISVLSGSMTIPIRVESNDIFRGKLEPASTALQGQQQLYGTSYFHDTQLAQRYFDFSTHSPRSSISQEDTCSMTLTMNQMPITEVQPAPETSNIVSRGPNERQVGSLTVATSNLALSTPCTSPSVTSPYSTTQMQLDAPTVATEWAMDSLGESSGMQCILTKGKRRTRGSKGDLSGLSAGDPSLHDGAGSGLHKKIANKRSRDRLNHAFSTSLPLHLHPPSTLVPFAFSPASSDPLPHTPSASSSPSVASSSSISMGLPPQPPGFHHSTFSAHTSSMDLPKGQALGIAPAGNLQYARLHPSESQQFRPANLQYNLQQVPPAQQPSYNFNTALSPPPPLPPPSKAFVDTSRNVRTVAGMNTFKDPATGAIHTFNSPKDLPKQILDRRRSSQGYSSDTVSTPGEGYPARSDYFGYPSLPSQPPQPSMLYHPCQQDQTSQLLSGHQVQYASQVLNMQQQQQQHQQQQQRRQEPYQFLQQQQQYQQLLLQQKQHQLQLQHQQHLQMQQQQLQHLQQAHRSQFGSIFSQVDPQELGTQSDDEYSSHVTFPGDALTTDGRVKVPRTRARSRTLPTLGNLEDIEVELLAQDAQALIATSSYRIGDRSESAEPLISRPSIATAVHLRVAASVAYLQDEHRLTTVPLPPARVAVLGYRSPSPSPEKDTEADIVPEALPDREEEVEETAVSSISIESASSSSTAVSSRQPRHPCPRCSKRFTRPFNLRSHMLAHDNERPYACDGKMATGAKCKSRFSRRADLVRHVKAKHPNNTKDKDRPQESTSSNNTGETD